MVPAIIIFIIAIIIAVFKSYEMTFFPFFLALLRVSINPRERKWDSGVDSFQPIDIGHVQSSTGVKTENIQFESKMDQLKNLEDKISKL
jgi:hypothetical protein